jgi:hypothetical protein
LFVVNSFSSSFVKESVVFLAPKYRFNRHRLPVWCSARRIFDGLLLRAIRQEHRANRYLVAFLLTFALALVNKFLIYTRHLRGVPQLFGLFWPLDFAYGPLVYFLLKSVNRAALCVDTKAVGRYSSTLIVTTTAKATAGEIQ